jgi:hypothetical protein
LSTCKSASAHACYVGPRQGRRPNFRSGRHRLFLLPGAAHLSGQLALTMKLLGRFVGLLLSLALMPASYAMTRIGEDKGGSLGEYLVMFATIRDSGERVVIDGTCSSACTLVTALIDPKRVCITERAALGFHATWSEDETGNRVMSTEGTQLLYAMYPPRIQRWIVRHGGLGPDIIVMKGRELARLYRFCDSAPGAVR